MRLFSFDIQAKHYASYCKAQAFFAQKLIAKLVLKWGRNFGNVADLGCGGGELLEVLKKEEIKFCNYYGCDLSASMLQNIQKQNHYFLFCQDFDLFLENDLQFDLILSSSALQWSKSLSQTLQNIASKKSKVAFSLMSGGTFASLHSFLQTQSPLLDAKNMQKLLLDFFVGEVEISQITLRFDSNDALLEHLRKSGVMGGGVLKYKEAKRMLEYQGELEYESILFVGQSK